MTVEISHITGGLVVLRSAYGVDSDDEMESVEANFRSALSGCSNQRLRSIKMALHKRANVDTRVTYKDIAQVLQVNVQLDSH